MDLTECNNPLSNRGHAFLSSNASFEVGIDVMLVHFIFAPLWLQSKRPQSSL